MLNVLGFLISTDEENVFVSQSSQCVEESKKNSPDTRQSAEDTKTKEQMLFEAE